jgi:hypothetical protein
MQNTKFYFFSIFTLLQLVYLTKKDFIIILTAHLN